MTITSALVRDGVLAPAMESLCHNLQQFDPSPEIDSDCERLREALLLGDHDAAHRYLDRIMESNLLEGELTGEAAENGDRLAADLHHRETRGEGIGFPTLAIVRRLRDPLKVVRKPSDHTAKELTFAHQIIKDTVREIPAGELLKASVRRELGNKLFSALSDYLDSTPAS